ncbi:MAG: hypothetical protein OJJ55_06640 [Rhodococcus sp.]|nr:hypothetical protein [Rhodococcus sp. (in: high G+C Gram-positive bacteria)]
MTTDEKIAAGWVETSPNHWQLPDGPTDRSDANGYEPTRRAIVTRPDGSLAVAWSRWSTAPPEPLLDSDGSPLVITPAMVAARRRVFHARLAALAARRAATHQHIVMADLIDAACGVVRVNVPGFGDVVFPRDVRPADIPTDENRPRALSFLKTLGAESHRRITLTRGAVNATMRQSIRVTMFGSHDGRTEGAIHAVYRAACDAASATVAARRAVDTLRALHSPARKAVNASANRRYRARVMATETAEQRDERRARNATRARERRARIKAAALAAA